MTAGRKIYAPQFEFAVRYIAVRDIEGMGSCWQDILGDHLRRRSGRRSNVSGAHTPGFSYFPMMYAVLKGWAQVGKEFTYVTTDDEVDELMWKTTPM